MPFSGGCSAVDTYVEEDAKSPRDNAATRRLAELADRYYGLPIALARIVLPADGRDADEQSAVCTRLYENLACLFDDDCVALLSNEIVFVLVDNNVSSIRSHLHRLFASTQNNFVWAGIDGVAGPNVGYAYGIPHDDHDFFEMLAVAGTELERSRRDKRPSIRGRAYDENAPFDGRASVASRREGHDTLTGLLNLSSFREHASYFTKDPVALARGISVIYFCIESLGSYTERYGAEAEDRLVRDVAFTISDTFYGFLATRVSQLGFCVVSYGAEATERTANICNYVNRHGINSQTHVILKAGIYALGTQPEQPEICLEKARVAYQSIERRFDRSYAIYDEKLRRAGEHRQFIIDNLEQAIESQDIVPAYQPIIRSATGKVFAVEVLARWRDKTYGDITPDQFIPVCEEAHIIHLLDSHIIRMACRDWRRLVDDGHTPMCLSINVSRLDFRLCDIVDIIDRAVVENRIPRSLVHIEITESVFTDAPETLRHAMGAFKSKGYQLWMDDYGSGYSSLEALRTYSFDAVKLDKTFILNNTGETRSEVVTASTIDMSKQLGLQTVCEGVETTERADFLRDVGCDFQQGFLYARPMFFPELEAKLSSGELVVENPDEQGYRNAASRVNLLSPQPFVYADPTADVRRNEQAPLAIVERDAQGELHLLTRNQSFASIMHGMGFSKPTDVEDAFKGNSTAFRRHIDAIFDSEGQIEKFETFDFAYRGMSYSCKARRLATHDGAVEALITIVPESSLGDIASEQGGIRTDQLALPLENVYNQIYIIDVEGRTVTLAFRNELSFDQPFSDTVTLEEATARFADKIYPPSRKRFAEFMNVETFKDRIAKSGHRHLAESFKVVDAGGEYRWQSISLMPAVIENRESIVYCVRDTNMGVVRGVATPNESVPHHLLWDAMVDAAEVGFFWKDRNLRYAGANRTLMDFFGISTLNEIVGKTDEEIGWELDSNLFKAAEQSVVRHGRTINNLRETCVAKGRAREITIFMTPVYSDGEFAGTCGIFNEITTHRDAGAEQNASFSYRDVDDATGCLNARGLISDGALFCTKAEERGKTVALVEVEIANIEHLEDLFGSTFVVRIIVAVAQKLLSTYGMSSVIARTAHNRFIVCHQLAQDESAEELARQIETDIENLAEVDGREVSIEALGAHALLNEASTFEEARALVEERLEARRAEEAESGEELIESVSMDALLRTMRVLKHSFDIVRLVDPSATETRELGPDGETLEQPYCCYSTWHRSERCVNCISAKAVSRRKTQTKYEVCDGEVFYVTSQPIIVDGKLRALELGIAFKPDDSKASLGPLHQIGWEDKGEDPKYHDVTTGAYNKRFYDEEIASLVATKVMLVNIDNFSAINKSVGYAAGDRMLAKIVRSIAQHTRPHDLVIRYSGDEFLIVFDSDMPSEVFSERLEQIRSGVEGLEFEEYPKIQLTGSIGAVDSAGFVADLVVKAREEMAEAKQTGNAISLFAGSIARSTGRLT